jgi:hypothetical protein
VRRIEYIRHWEAEKAALNAAMKDVDQHGLEGLRDDINLYDKIRRTIDGLTKTLQRMNAPSVEELSEDAFRILFAAISQELDISS